MRNPLVLLILLVSVVVVVVAVVVVAVVVVVVRKKKFECDDARDTRAEQYARNPREKQTRISAEPARNGDARNPRVLLILLVLVVVVVVVVIVIIVITKIS